MALLTRYVDHSLSTGLNDGTSEANAWWFLYKMTAAIKTDAGTNNYKVYVKASETYGTDGTSPNPAESDDAGHDGAGGDAGAVIYLDQGSPGATMPNVIEGYAATPGDGGIVTIDCAYDGANKLTNGIWMGQSVSYNTVFKNFDVVNASGDGFFGSNLANILTFKNCRFKGNGSEGITGNNDFALENCILDGNGADGIDLDNNVFLLSCISRNNTLQGLHSLGNVIIYNTLVYDNGNVEQIINQGSVCVLGCTIDANNGAASRCFRQDANTSRTFIANSIIFDGAIGILCDDDIGEMNISRNCLFNSNIDDASNFLVEYDGGDGAPATGNGVGDLGHVTGVPGFTGTYLPGSNAQSAALDHQYTNNFWASFDAADNPPEPENE
ncbi:hypothetical protein LCGC14_0580580 [marine sediment metagenome]|uniref:Right handed beta helix domain-containing protein n=1 Tax=marine sediment metagenome TaxID=412755 RepID=A0A0F9U2M3_9ZZZZ